MTTASKRRRSQLAGFADEAAPRFAIVTPPALLVGELDRDLAADLFDLACAGLALRWEGERRVLLVLGRGVGPYHAKRRIIGYSSSTACPGRARPTCVAARR